MLNELNWKKEGGLLPAIVQNADTEQVLMLGYMNEAALAETVRTKRVTFFSRSRNRLWTKGETSGHFLNLVSFSADCDGDAILLRAKPTGPTCHRLTASCFSEEAAPGIGFISHLEELIDRRYRDRPAGSYTTTLFEAGIDRIVQKVGEESVEVVIAAKNPDRTALKDEAADLLYHLMVLLRQKQIPFGDVVDVLRRRHQNGTKVV